MKRKTKRPMKQGGKLVDKLELKLKMMVIEKRCAALDVCHLGLEASQVVINHGLFRKVINYEL